MTASHLYHIIFDITGICVTAHSFLKLCSIYTIRHRDTCMQLFSCHIPYKRKRQYCYFVHRDYTKNFNVCV